MAITLLFLVATMGCAPGPGSEPANATATPGDAKDVLRYSIPANDEIRYLELNRSSFPYFAAIQCPGQSEVLKTLPEPRARPTFRIPPSEHTCEVDVRFAQGPKSNVAYVSSASDYHREAMQRSQILSVGMVGLTVLTLYSLSLSVALRNRIYILFLYFSLTFLAYHAFRTGYFREWGIHAPALASHLMQLMQLVYPGGLLLFALEFRGSRRTSPFFHWIILTSLSVALVASVYRLPGPLVAGMEMALLTAALISSFASLGRKDGPGLLISNAMLYICTLAANLQDPAIPVHPALENVSMIGGLLHILGVSGVIGFRIHNLRQGELRARHRSRQTWKAALDSLEQARETKREFMSRMGARLIPALEGVQQQARKLLSQGSRASEGSARRIIDEAGRLLQLLHHSTESKERIESVSLARITEDALTLLQLFPGAQQPRLINDVDTDLHVRVDSDQYVRTLSEFLENLSFLKAPETVTISASARNGTVEIRISVFGSMSSGHTGNGRATETMTAIRDSSSETSRTAAGQNGQKEEAKRSDAKRSGALMERLSKDFLTQSLQTLDPRAAFFPAEKGEFRFSLPGAKPENPEIPETVQEIPDGPYALIYSEDMLYGPRLRSRLSEWMPCLTHDQIPPSWKHDPAVVVLDVLDLRSRGPAAFMQEMQRRMEVHPPVLVLSRSEDRSLFPELAGQGLGDWITKPISTDLIVDRVQSLLSMNQKLQEQKKYYHSLARENRSQIRRSLHDSLGAQLTDLKFLAEQLDRDGNESILGEEVDRTIRMLQDSLQDLEDSHALAADMIPALEDNIVRRYTRASRKIRRNFEYKKLQLPAEVADDLFRVFQELVTNDLKYGSGTARWSLRSEEDGIRVELESSTRYDPSTSIHGMGTASIMTRVHDMGARIKMHIDQGIFFASIFLPAQIFAVYSPGND